MDDQRIRPGVWIGVVGLLAAVATVVFVLEPRRSAPRPAVPSRAEEPAAAPDAAPQATARREREPARTAEAPQQEVPYIDGLVYGEIDLREARELMPDNIYWKQGAPTKDPEELARRDEERRRLNEEYGRVLSGDASEDEVRAYYDQRRRVSTDYLEFSEFMARRYRDSDNKEFVGMLELATKMHAAKLKQIDEDLENALARSRERARIREEWQRQKEEFGDQATPPADDEAVE